jgi:hypothetical protein
MARRWHVESKSFEMLIKGGNSGLRMVERGRIKQGSIFIQRDEIAWMVGAVEEVLEVDSSAVYWDPSSAGFPRVLVQRRSNRHGNFIFIEEYEGRNRRGSVLIPEGRYGQGWSRLISELRIARQTLWKGREFSANKGSKVVSGRSFAEVVGRPKLLESGLKVVPATTVAGSSALEYLGERGQLNQQMGPAISAAIPDGESEVTAEAGGRDGAVPLKAQVQAKEKREVGNGNPACALPKALQNPVKSGKKAPYGDCESEGHGHVSVREGFDLQVLQLCLLDIKGQLDAGLKRVEEAFFLLGQWQRMGCVRKAGDLGPGVSHSRSKQQTGFKRCNEGMGWSKPKKKTFRSLKSQPGLLGPKPSKASSILSQGPGPKSSCSYRILSRSPAQVLQQAGESSAIGAARATGGRGTSIASVSSGEHSSDAGIEIPATVAKPSGTEIDGELNGEDEIGGEASSQRVASGSEGADGLGTEHSLPERNFSLSVSSTTLLSTIPECDEALGHTGLSPVMSSKCLSGSSEQTGDEDSDSFTPEKLAKQWLVFQRRESLCSKTTKSWVAERVSWNGDRGPNGTTEALMKKLNSGLVSEESPAIVGDMLGENEEVGLLGDLGNQGIEFPGVEGPISGSSMAGVDSVVAEKQDRALIVGEVAGLTCEGQPGLLKEFMGQIVVENLGRSSGGERGSHVINES